MWIFGKLLRRAEEERARLRAKMAAEHRAVVALSLDEARAGVAQLLADPTGYEVVEAPPSAEDRARLAALAPELRAFFERYALVQRKTFETRLERTEIGPSVIDRRLLQLGTGFSHVYIVSRPGEEAVFETDGLEPVEHPPVEFPSIYHFLVHDAWYR